MSEIDRKQYKMVKPETRCSKNDENPQNGKQMENVKSVLKTVFSFPPVFKYPTQTPHLQNPLPIPRPDS